MTPTPNAVALGLVLSLALVPAVAGAQATPRQPATPTTAPATALPAVTGTIATDAVAARPFGAAKAPGPQITLAQAVDLALTYQPRVSLAAQDTLIARAQLREARGLFDSTFTLAPGADYTQQPVAPGFLRQQLNNRTLMKQLHLGFTRANLQLRDILVNSNAPLPRCPARLQLRVRHRRHHARRFRRG